MSRPRLLDLFCGAGGAAVGYNRAGFEIVVGIDVIEQPRYPFDFCQADAVGQFDDILDSFGPFDFIHASPPCQLFSTLSLQDGYGRSRRNIHDFHLDLITPIREKLVATGLPYVIENVPRALPNARTLLCGTMFPPLCVIRHRRFESNWPISMPPHLKQQDHPRVDFKYDLRKAHKRPIGGHPFVGVYGGPQSSGLKSTAMGIDWMLDREINEAIPPAYTEWIGRQILALGAWRYGWS